MPVTQPVDNSRRPAALVLAALVMVVGALLASRLLAADPAADAPSSQLPATSVAAAPTPTAVPVETPTGVPPATSPAVIPAESPAPRPTDGLASAHVLSPGEFQKAFVSGGFVGYTMIVQGRIVAARGVPGDRVSDGIDCDGEQACVYGELEGARADGGTRPLLVWSRRIATPLGPDDRPDEYWWPSRARSPLPVEGVLVLRIDTTYSVEYLGRAVVDEAGLVWAAESVVVLDPDGLAVDEVVLVDAWLAGQDGRPCPHDDFEPPLPSSECGDPSWIFRQGSPLSGHAPNHVPVQNDAYRLFVAGAAPQATGLFEPRRGLWVLGRRLELRGACGEPACPRWHVLDQSLPGHVDRSSIAAVREPPAIDDTGWTEVTSGRVVAAAWSRDGRWLLVTNLDRILLVDARSGAQVRGWEFRSDELSRGALWVDERSFLALPPRPRGLEAGSRVAPAMLGRIDSDRLVEVDVPVAYEDGVPFMAAVAGGDGAVAVITTDDRTQGCGADGCWSFRIWTVDRTSRERSGLPIAWSAAGDLLAVIHNDRPTRAERPAVGAGFGGYSGWLEVLRWPGGKTVFADRGVTVHEESAFDPSGERLATAVWPPAWVHLGTGRVHEMSQRDVYLGRVWDESGRLFGVDGNGTVSVHDPDGDLVASWPGAGHLLVGSADGSRQVAWLSDPTRGAPFGVFTALRGGRLPVRFALPDEPRDTFLFEASLSPDGRAFAVWIVDRDSGHNRLMLHLIE